MIVVKGYPSYWRAWVDGEPLKTTSGHVRIFSGLDTAVRTLERAGYTTLTVEVAR